MFQYYWQSTKIIIGFIDRVLDRQIVYVSRYLLLIHVARRYLDFNFEIMYEMILSFSICDEDNPSVAW